MAVLKSLTFTTLPTTGGNPILDRRSKIIARLEEQKLILKDPNYTRTVRNWVKKDGERVMVEKQQRVPLWWRQHPNGSYALFVRSGLKPIEFEKGTAASIWIVSLLACGKSTASNLTPASIKCDTKATLRANRSNFAMIKVARCRRHADRAAESCIRPFFLPLSTSVNSAMGIVPFKWDRTASCCAARPKPLRPWRIVLTL